VFFEVGVESLVDLFDELWGGLQIDLGGLDVGMAHELALAEQPAEGLVDAVMFEPASARINEEWRLCYRRSKIPQKATYEYWDTGP